VLSEFQVFTPSPQNLAGGSLVQVRRLAGFALARNVVRLEQVSDAVAGDYVTLPTNNNVRVALTYRWVQCSDTSDRVDLRALHLYWWRD
jgi:hypothetical protein